MLIKFQIQKLLFLFFGLTIKRMGSSLVKDVINSTTTVQQLILKF
jgi:hypothetical protein